MTWISCASTLGYALDYFCDAEPHKFDYLNRTEMLPYCAYYAVATDSHNSGKVIISSVRVLGKATHALTRADT